MGAAGVDDAQSLEIAAAGVDSLIVPFQLKARHFGGKKFGAEGLGLADHFRSELFAVSFENAGIVHHFCGNRNLAAHLFLFDDQHMKPRPCHINSGGEPCRSSAYYYGIIYCIHDAS